MAQSKVKETQVMTLKEALQVLLKDKGIILNNEKNEDGSYKSVEKSYKERSKSNDQDVLFKNLEWLTTAEAATYLRKSQNAIRQMVCRGQLRARKFHRRLYFKRIELDIALDTSFY